MSMIAMAAPTDADSLRLRHEFIVAPALCLTIAQTARLLNVHQSRAAAILDDLEQEGWLIRLTTGRYRRPQPLAA
jgi:predicted transcriptional regulator of viral defense system